MENKAKSTPIVRLNRATSVAVERLAKEERRTVANMTHILLEDALNARGIFLKSADGWRK
ncbi:hypothetical protein P375_07985 [Gallibacterium genomosp. 2]|uniref:Uncharacterized protein n=1 Tax=Gallibacterium genomosp. 2 TaxID=155517 RepID=A0A0A2XKR7_9PAST|nr:hypothetical protein [Gallibacterium genomosp. 2]KGQ31210.1 hypothetical protein P375_07985 [Gallibacterium genomosp. 2]KGQ52198.1 hypothetical protein JL12_01665 [Gallibacterium anatis 10672-6]